MYVRMVIGEAIDDQQVAEFARIYDSEILPELINEPGIHSARLIIEEGGTMAVSLTLWHSREACLNYHSGRSYRRFAEKLRHLLVGEFVVKLFRVHALAVK